MVSVESATELCFDAVESGFGKGRKMKITVIMPSLNVAPYIEKCIQSVVNQTLQDIEILCIDAGSTDGTLEILEQFKREDSRIRIIHSDKKVMDIR